MPVSGGVAWGADGNGLLFWGLAAMGGAAHQTLPRFALLGQPLSGGPVRVVLPARPANWIEGIPPAPVLSPDGWLIASLLGMQGGLNSLVLFPRDGAPPRHIALPGEPRLVAFAPSGPWATVVWNAYRDSGDVRRATLVNTATGQVQDFGPAVAAFWR